jgi:hypothetical protein
VVPRAVLDVVVKRKIPSPRRESNPRTPDRPARSLVPIPTELSRLFNHRSVEYKNEILSVKASNFKLERDSNLKAS